MTLRGVQAAQVPNTVGFVTYSTLSSCATPFAVSSAFPPPIPMIKSVPAGVLFTKASTFSCEAL